MKKTIISTIFAAGAAFILNGCGTDAVNADAGYGKAEAASETPIALGIVIANRADFDVPNIADAEPFFEQNILRGGETIVTVSDGHPDRNMRCTPFAGLLANGKIEEHALQKQKEACLSTAYNTVLSESPAKAENAAVLDALSLTAEVMNDPENVACTKQILIYDNGLSTAGAITLNDLSSLDVEGDVADLAARGLIPDLSGFSVDWYGLGMTSQAVYPDGIGAENRAKLGRYWEAILIESGADYSFHNSVSFTERDAEQVLPAVKKLDLSGTERPVQTTCSTASLEEIFTETQTTAALPPLAFAEDEIGFKPNSETEFADEALAQQQLSKLSVMLQNNPQDIILIGCTASVKSSDLGAAFGRNRANTVKDMLVRLGVPAESIRTAGSGYSDRALTAEDRLTDSSGNFLVNEKGDYILDKTIAQGNRTVWMFSLLDSDNREVFEKYLS